MPITYEMLCEGRVALLTMPSVIEIADLLAIFDIYRRETLDRATKPVYLISDSSAVIRFPPNIVGSTIGLMKYNHPMYGPIIAVTPNALIKILVRLLINAFGVTAIIG